MCRGEDERNEPSTFNLKRSTSLVHLPPTVVLWLALLALLAIACQGRSGSIQVMAEQPRYDTFEPSDFFADGMSERPAISGTIAYGEAMTDTLLYRGLLNGAPATTYPFPVTREVMVRGQEQFNVFCSPCHGVLGDGNGLVAQRGFCCPANFHTDRLRSAPEGHFFEVITEGMGRMPNYAYQVAPRDRWAIIAYIRVLQRSQNATINDVPPDRRNLLNNLTP